MKKYLKNWKVLTAIIIGLLIVIMFWQKSQLEKAIENTKQWIKTSAAGAEWKASIEKWASESGLDFETALDQNVRAAVRKSNPFGFLV